MQELSAQQYVQDHRPRSWSRSTVADGRWMQDKTFTPLNGNDEQLGIFIDDLVKGLNTEETTRANADEAEAAARLAYDGILSGRCDFLYTSASKLREDLTTETSDRQDGDAATLRDAKAYADNASAYALSEAKTYADTASSYLDKRIDGVSSTFDTYTSQMNTWKSGIDTWQTGINKWRNETVDPALTNLQSQIDAFENATDVADVVPTSGSLNGYNKRLTPGAVIKVLSAGPGNDQQFYYRNKLEKTSAGPFSIQNFDVLGSVQPYYSKSETYSKSEVYDKSEMDALLLKKLDVSAHQVWAISTIQYPGYGPDQFVNTLNECQIMAHVDSDFNVISETYVKKGDLISDYATKAYVNGTFASANNVYAKNQTSSTNQLNTAFGNKLDTSAAFKGELLLNSPGGGTKYDLDTLWFERRFSSEPEELKLDDDQEDLKIYAYPIGDSSYSAKKYIGTFKYRKELYLENKELAVHTNSRSLPDFENFPNRYFII